MDREIEQKMETRITASVVAVKEDDRRHNFRFSAKDVSDEMWCVGSLKVDSSIHLKVGDRVNLIGYWIEDFYGCSVAFFAEQIEKVNSTTCSSFP